jgi:hypothetical protein
MLVRTLKGIRSDREKLQLLSAFALNSATIIAQNHLKHQAAAGDREKKRTSVIGATKAPNEDEAEEPAFSIGHVEELLRQFYFGTDEQLQAIELLVERLEAPHQALRLLPVMKPPHAEAVKMWILSGRWPSPREISILATVSGSAGTVETLRQMAGSAEGAAAAALRAQSAAGKREGAAFMTSHDREATLRRMNARASTRATVYT